MKRLVAKHFGWLVGLVAVFLGACTQTPTSQLGSLAVNLGNIRGLSNNQLLFALPSRTCSSSSRLLGQGFNSSGTRKKQYAGLGYDTFTTSSKTPFNVGSDLKTSFFSGAIPQTSTAILVVDYFGKDNPATNQNEEVYTLGNALFTQPTMNANTLAALESQGALSHGALVLRHIEEEIQGTGLYTFNSSASSASKKVYQYFPGSGEQPLRLEVITINLSSLSDQSTNGIANAIRSTLLTLLSTNPKLKTVINMSFALMPCTVFEDYLVWGSSNKLRPSFANYMANLANYNNVRTAELTAAVIETTNPLDPATKQPADPLAKLVDGRDPKCPVQCNSQNNIYVAAAGNYSLNVTMYPANWPKVVSVTGSSLNAPTQRATQYFNKGEVMTTGATFKLNPPVSVANAKPLYYMGTSFAAPTVSVYSALDLATVQRCAELGQSPLSELAKDTPRLVDRPLETMGSTSGAVQVRCGAN